ncbi:MAG: GTPase HflX [Chloroflexi bacterium RBG_16_60_22]|nr:MAG: GTPase HflX [Chloroflexi bacterium RBG_16_60_22]
MASKGSREKQAAESSMAELVQLVTSAGAEVVGKIIQHLTGTSGAYYVGKGKLQELIDLREKLDYTVLVLDDELAPSQQHNLEEALKVKVIDRAALILDIFARRARTREGRLQVELAQHQYLLPRLAGQWLHLERLGGGIGTRGPGESQLETDRRLIRRKIQHLKEQIEDVRKQRSLYRQKRQKSGVPVVALVGYTNAGKSTLLNALCQADVLTDDRLFATLDSTTRRLTLPDRTTVLLTDTVGFIRKLPPAIISAFRATLEELGEANLLLHVVDLASPDAAAQCRTVEDILGELALADKPRLTVLNKIDLLLERQRYWDEKSALDYLSKEVGPPDADTVLVSAVRKWGLARLQEMISGCLVGNTAVPKS